MAREERPPQTQGNLWPEDGFPDEALNLHVTPEAHDMWSAFVAATGAGSMSSLAESLALEYAGLDPERLPTTWQRIVKRASRINGLRGGGKRRR
jgi:hypothetical protein